MERRSIANSLQAQYGLVEVVHGSPTIKDDFILNGIDCDCYAPLWMHPYTKLGFSRPMSGHGLYYNFYTDQPSEFGYSENQIAYFWLVQSGTVDYENFGALLRSVAMKYLVDATRPDAITWVPETVHQNLRDDIQNRLELKFVPCQKEFVYETARLVAYDMPDIRSRSRSGMRRYGRDPQYRNETLQQFVSNYGTDKLLHFLNEWYKSKENVDNYPNFECMQVTLTDLDSLLAIPGLAVDGYVVSDGDKIIAFSLCSSLNADSWAFLGRFTDPTYPYISDYMMSKTAELYRRYTFCHDGGAGGRAGLAEFKQRLVTVASQAHAEQYYAVLPASHIVNPQDYNTAGIHF